MGWFIFAVIVVAFVWAVMSAIEKAKVQADQAATFRASHAGWDIYVSPYAQKVLGIGRETSEILLGSISMPIKFKLVDVASVEVLKDGATITSTNRGSQLAGAALGGLALGGVGLLLGGLSGSKRNRATIQSLGIKVIVDNRAAPVHTVEFFRSPGKDGIDAKSALVTPALAEVERFHALLLNALRSIHQTLPTNQGAAALPPPGTADQIARLWELKQAGALTDEEFAAQKTRLLAQPGAT